MANRFVQNITVEESTSIHWVKEQRAKNVDPDKVAIMGSLIWKLFQIKYRRTSMARILLPGLNSFLNSYDFIYENSVVTFLHLCFMLLLSGSIVRSLK